MTTPAYPSVTDELLDEIELEAGQVAYSCCGNETTGCEYAGAVERICCGSPDSTGDEISVDAFTVMQMIAELRTLRAENAELKSVIRDVRWRVWDTTDQLQAYSFNGDRLYGLDEWSVPIKNLNMAVGILDKSMEQTK